MLWVLWVPRHDAGARNVPPGVPGTSPARGPLTQQGGGAVAQGVLLVTGHAERRDGVEGLGQEGLQARGAGVGRMEEVVDLLTGGTQLGH